MPKFGWSKARTDAAKLFAEGELNAVQIASAVGVTFQAVYQWLKRPEFQARIDEEVAVIKLALGRRKISHVEQRVSSQNCRWLRCHQVINERADDPVHADIPGWRTGLLVHTRKAIGFGEKSSFVDEFTLDTGLLKEMRELEKQAAQELGQWQDRVTVKSQPTDEPTLSPEQASAALDAINGCDDQPASDSSDPTPDA